MAVTAYDGSFSFKQDSLARLGDRAHRPAMSAADMASFQNSPFMQSMRRIDELTFQKMSIRDKKRQATDPSFKPKDEDFEAEKSFKYDKCMNYYKTLGVDEYTPQKECKDAYKRLSLVYHPDKTAGLPSEVKEEYALIFIELKSAYQTLADNPTRRQYDRDRDKDQAAAELNGWKVKERAQFDATEVLKKLQEHKDSKKPSKIVELTARCRLEKFFYGGHKAIKRKRNAKNKMGYFEEERNYRIDVPAGHCEPFVADFRRQGDCHDDQHADTLRFKMTSKPHERVERKDKDLHVKSQVPLGEDVETQPYITAQVASIRGRQLLLWGVNPFFRKMECGGSAQLKVRVQGEGLGEAGTLIFTAKPMAVTAEVAPTAEASGAEGAARLGEEPQGDGRVLIKVKHLMTEGELYLKVNKMDSVGDIRKQCIALLGLARGSMLKLLKPLGQGKFTPHADSAMLRDLMSTPLPPGEIRTFNCGGTEWFGPTLNTEKSLAFLKKVIAASEEPQMRLLLAVAKEASEPKEKADAKRRYMDKLADVLLDFGFRPVESVLEDTMKQAVVGTARVPEGGHVRAKLQALQAEWEDAQKGAAPGKAKAKAAEEPARPTWAPGVSESKRFLERFKLAPEDGFKEREVPPAMRRRVLRRASREPVCEVLLQPFGGPVTLHTKPGCQLYFYSNFEGCSPASSSRAEPCTLFAVCLASQACSKGKLANEWDRLKYKVLPLLQASCFKLLRLSRSLLPKPLSAQPAFGSWGRRRVDPEDGSEYTWEELRQLYRSKYSQDEIVYYWDNVCKPLPAPPMPWKRLGDEAFRRSDFWTAIELYSEQLEDMPQTDANEASARVLCNRAACYAKVKEYGMSLLDGRMASKLFASWARPWSRVGYAASMCGAEEDLGEARAAYFRAVELEPNDANVKSLYDVVQKGVQSSDAEASHAAKERGNEAIRVKEWSTAVAAYTEGLAQLPPEAFSDTEEQLPFLRCVLLCNRSGAFARMRNWNAAAVDAEEAVQIKKGFAKAHCRLGVALLGNRHYERAYTHFSKSLVLQEDYMQARKGRNECLREILRWRSVPAVARLERRLKDASRPRGTSRVFAICDVHFDHKVNEDWAHAIDDGMFQDDVLIVAGDLAGTKGAIFRGLTTLRQKFRRVFYTVGHHEMWVHYGEHERYPDSIAKLHGILEACDELGVDVVPDAICEDVFIVPLLSWYNAEFDEQDPWPDPLDKMDSQTRWPMDADDQVWKYMLKMNEGAMGLPFHGTIITFSHFLPRRNLPLPRWPGMKTAKSSGCERLDDLIRGVRSKLHVFGHSHERYFACHAGVTYVNQPLGFSNEQQAVDLLPMLMVYDGRNTCARPWDIAQNRPQ